MRRFTNWNGNEEEDIITASRRRRMERMMDNVEIFIIDDTQGVSPDIRELLNRSLYDQELKRDDRIELNIEKIKCEKDDEKSQCMICMSSFQENEIKSCLNCKHEFHYDCIREWGKRKQECPLCRESIEMRK